MPPVILNSWKEMNTTSPTSNSSLSSGAVRPVNVGGAITAAFPESNPPPAPRVTTQAILAERLSPRDPDEATTFEVSDPNDLSFSSSDSAGENFFEQAFDECVYDDLNQLERDELIARIRDRDREVDRLRSEIAALKEASAISVVTSMGDRQ